MVCFAVLCVTQKDLFLSLPSSPLSLLCRLFPLRRRDDLFGQIVQLALLLFRCISCNYWPNGANRLQIAFRESCHSRISTYWSYGKFRVKAASISNSGGNIMWSTAQHSCRCCPVTTLSLVLPNNNYRKLTSFHQQHQQQERSFPELPAG